MKLKSLGVVLLLILTLSLFSACSPENPQTTPKDTVISLFGAMDKNDQPALAHILDLAYMMSNTTKDYALSGGDEPRVFTNPQKILEDLTNEGLTKTKWFSMQRIINKVDIVGESATVEVTFVDKDASKGYQTKFGLHFVNNKWKIYSFNIMTPLE